MSVVAEQWSKFESTAKKVGRLARLEYYHEGDALTFLDSKRLAENKMLDRTHDVSGNRSDERAQPEKE